MSGFNGSTGVPTKQMEDAIAQSTAKVDKYDGYTTNIVQMWNQGFLSRGNATVQYFDGAIYISVTGITTKTSTQDWIFKLKGAYCPQDGLYFKYHSGQTEKSCYVNTNGYLYLQGGLDTTSSVALSISFAV